MASLCNRHIQTALDLTRQLIELADKGQVYSEDDGCVLLYGIIRDCAYRIKAEAERERDIHLEAGIWESSSPAPGD